MINELLWGDTTAVGLQVLGWTEPSYHLWCSASRDKPLVLALCATHLISKTSTSFPCPHLLIPLRYCQSTPEEGYSVQDELTQTTMSLNDTIYHQAPIPQPDNCTVLEWLLSGLKSQSKGWSFHTDKQLDNTMSGERKEFLHWPSPPLPHRCSKSISQAPFGWQTRNHYIDSSAMRINSLCNISVQKIKKKQPELKSARFNQWVSAISYFQEVKDATFLFYLK